MSNRELKRYGLIQQVLDGKLKQIDAAEMLELSNRQVRRLTKRVGNEGAKGVIHRNRGRRSNNRMSDHQREKLIEWLGGRYRGFGPTLAAEVIENEKAWKVGRETIRKLLKAANLSYERRRHRPHRQWRERKAHCGEMVQMDGSHHDWFEGRGPRCVLMGYVDDATGRVFARFYEYEGTRPALDSFRRYISKYGIPLSAYLDKHGAYKVNGKQTVEEQLNDRDPMTQFERAMKELGVHVIHAHSPQAKGRVERLFETFQDRLIKLMRLKNVSTIEEGNQFLEAFLPDYNRQFSRAAQAEADLHRSNPGYQVLLRTLCIREERTVKNDSTFQYDGKTFLITDRTWARKVIIEERLDDRRVVRHKDRELRYREVKVPKKTVKEDERPAMRIGGIRLDVGVKIRAGKSEKWPAPMGAVHEAHQTF